MSFMDLQQKIKGIAQEAKGQVEEHTGHPVKGAVDKIKGKANIAIADAKMKAKK